ncbi:MAG: hypothetical protein EBQ92_03595 [Proteobacteria bacterium]|nr:hypothetical protein [Pseudomonadota bacterium]
MANEIEKRGNSYRFFPGNRWSWAAIRKTYKDFFSQGLSFWTEQSYDIPMETTVRVLLGLMVIESIVQGLLNARYDFLSRFVGQLGGLVGQGIFIGFVVLMKEWLEAKGSFREYLAFDTCARFILLPIALLSGLSTQLGLLLNFVGVLWILYASYRTFHVVLTRFLILVAIVWGIAGLAFLGAFITGLKMFG